MHDGNARAHEDRRPVQQRHAMGAAQRRGGGGQEEAEGERPHRTEPGDEHGTGHSGEREHEGRQRGKHADSGL